MIVVGGGPIGMEMAQGYQRLGSRVAVVADRLLPKDEPEASEVMQRVFEREGVRFVWAGLSPRAKKETRSSWRLTEMRSGEISC
jgi:pyruvate/2-oxoglutarate dehydrogenase complex dihydrolipoamide dehydrogenase (E3) component